MLFNVFYHVKKNSETKEHWDNMTIQCDSLYDIEHTVAERIENEFDYDVKDVDLIEAYEYGKDVLLKTIHTNKTNDLER